MAVLKKIKSHLDMVDYLKELPFYNKHIKKPKIKHLKNIDWHSELPFYEELNAIKTKGFKNKITLKAILKKYKPNGEIEFRSVYFNSTTKTVINHELSLENTFQ